MTCIQPNLSSGEAVGSTAYSGQTKQLAVCTRRFHDAMVVRRLRFRKLRKQNGVALIGQPWSYLRLDAYSFLWLCEGAYGAFGGSVLNDCTQGLAH